MNFTLKNIPNRTKQPRTRGITMIMDKGLSVKEVENLIEVAAPYIDLVKLGWSTSYVIANLKEKLAIYQANNIPVYFGGTLFEAFIVRNQFEDYRFLLDRFNMKYVEVSDGSIDIRHDKKCEYIRKLSDQLIVISEVGSKDEKKIIAPYKWVSLMKAELEAGSWKLIAEAREGGNIGLYRESGEVREDLVDEILTQIPEDTIIWEAPHKSQQVWFIKLLGANVNLGNIAPSEVISLETLRLGLRSDTFHCFIDRDIEYIINPLNIS